jgi:hypothetical protein
MSRWLRLGVALAVGAAASGAPLWIGMAYPNGAPPVLQVVGQVLILPAGAIAVLFIAPMGSTLTELLVVTALAGLLFYSALVWTLLGRPWRWFRRRFWS